MTHRPDCMVEFDRRSVLKACGTIGATGIASSLSGCLGSEDEFPSRTMTWVTVFSEGGGMDTTFRQIQPHLEEAFGQDITPRYESGAGTREGVIVALEEGADDLHWLLGTRSPSTPATIALDEDEDDRDPQYELDDIAPLGRLDVEPSLLRVRPDDDRFQTIEELVDYADDNPGEVSIGASAPTGRNMLAHLFLQEAVDVEFEHIVFEGGGPTETALFQEEIDVAGRSMFNSLDIHEETTCLCVFEEENVWEEITNDAPTANDALGLDVNWDPTVASGIYAVASSAADENPDDYEYLVEQFREAHQSEEYHEDLEEIHPLEPTKLDYLPPDETMEVMENTLDEYREFVPLFQEYVF